MKNNLAFWPRSNNTLTASSATFYEKQTKAFTIADVQRAAALLHKTQPEPIGEWMRSKNMPPEQWYVVFPEKMCSTENWPTVLPYYAKVSPIVDAPVFILRSAFELGTVTP